MSILNSTVNWDDEEGYIAKTEPFKHIQEIDGLSYYIIPIKMELFRGDNSKYIIHTRAPDTTIPITPTFYTTNPQLASEYGIVFKYETTKQYALLALDDKDNLQQLYNIISVRPGSEQILAIINKQYGLKHIDEHGHVLRDTKSELDKEFVAYLCSMQRDNGEPMFEGYATNSMKIPESGNNYTFHEELVICNPSLGVKFIEQITQGNSIKYALDAEAARKQKMSKNTRKSKRYHEDNENIHPNIKTFGFGSPPKNSEIVYGSPPKNSKIVYGSPPHKDYRTPGGKKQKTKSRKIKKKNSKTNKKRSQNKYNKSK